MSKKISKVIALTKTETFEIGAFIVSGFSLFFALILVVHG